MLSTAKTALLALFFGGLVAVWALDAARVRTSRQSAIAAQYVLPGLFDVRPGDVRRVEIDGPAGPLVLEKWPSGWAIAKPIRARAADGRVDGLISALRGLRRSGDAGSVRGSMADYGLDAPSRTIRVFGSDPKAPAATLELGKVVRDQRYVRDPAGPGADLVDPRLLGAVEGPVDDWRQRVVLPFSPIEVASVSIRSRGRSLDAERRGGRWEIVGPFRAPGDETKLDGLIADLVAIQVADGSRGFLGDRGKDPAAFGLDEPIASIELKGGQPARSASIVVGTSLPGADDRAYARRSGDDETLVIPSKVVGALDLAPETWRSRRLTNLNPARVNRVSIRREGLEHTLVLQADGWQVVRPSPGRADLVAVRQLLIQLSNAQAIEVRAPTPQISAALAPPEASIRVWEASETPTDREPAGPPALEVAISKVNPTRNLFHAQVAGDPTILGIVPKAPSLVDLLPAGPLGLRDRTLFAFREAVVDRITLTRAGGVTEVRSGSDTLELPSWRMTRPAPSTIDPESVGRLIVLLSQLRAERLLTDTPGDPKNYGLDRPELRIDWSILSDPARPRSASTPPPARTASLRIGAKVGDRSPSRFAMLDGRSTLFTLGADALNVLNAELKNHRVLDFRLDRVQSVELRWPDFSKSFRRRPKAFAGPDDWDADASPVAPSLTTERLNTLLTNMANLSTTRFLQYDGPIAADLGLKPAALTVSVRTGPGIMRPIDLRIGAARPDSTRPATLDPGDAGAVFLLPAAAWDAYVGAASPPTPGATAPAETPR